MERVVVGSIDDAHLLGGYDGIDRDILLAPAWEVINQAIWELVSRGDRLSLDNYHVCGFRDSFPRDDLGRLMLWHLAKDWGYDPLSPSSPKFPSWWKREIGDIPNLVFQGRVLTNVPAIPYTEVVAEYGRLGLSVSPPVDWTAQAYDLLSQLKFFGSHHFPEAGEMVVMFETTREWVELAQVILKECQEEIMARQARQSLKAKQQPLVPATWDLLDAAFEGAQDADELYRILDSYYYGKGEDGVIFRKEVIEELGLEPRGSKAEFISDMVNWWEANCQEDEEDEEEYEEEDEENDDDAYALEDEEKVSSPSPSTFVEDCLQAFEACSNPNALRACVLNALAIASRQDIQDLCEEFGIVDWDQSILLAILEQYEPGE